MSVKLLKPICTNRNTQRFVMIKAAEQRDHSIRMLYPNKIIVSNKLLGLFALG